MIFRTMAVAAVLFVASLAPAASSSCDQRIANLCPGALISETAAAAQPAATTAQPAAPMKITNGKRATRSAKRYHRSTRTASRHRRGKSTRHTSARKRTQTASTHSKRKHRSASEETDDMVGLASQEPDHGDKPLGNGPALGGGVPAEAVAEAAPAAQPAQTSASGRSLVNLGPAFAPIGANTLPSRTFMPVASNNPTTIVTAKTVNAPSAAPVRVASADIASTPVPAPAAVPQKSAPAQVMQASTLGGVEITTLRALFLAFGAVLLAGTAIRMAIG